MFGQVTLGGIGDYVKISDDDNDYAANGRFALAFWFTKAACRVPGDYEILYSHHADDGGWSGCRHGDDGKCTTCNPGIIIYLGCFSDGTDGYTASSTISGDVIRVMITDDDCRTAVFDTPLNKQAGGYITNQWVHFALSVWGRGAHTYVDGESVDTDEIGYPIATGRAARWWGWATGPGNIAYQSLENRGLRSFTEPLGSITLWVEPHAGRTFRQTASLKAGAHTFNPECRGCSYVGRYADQDMFPWGTQTKYEVTNAATGRTIAGGWGGDNARGTVRSINGEEYCETSNYFPRGDRIACEASSCCQWGQSSGNCWSDSGDRACMIHPGSAEQFTLAEDTDVIITIRVGWESQSAWAIQWSIDDGECSGCKGPTRGHVFLGARNDDADDWMNANFMGSIAGLKVHDNALRPMSAKCMFQDAETDVGHCDEVGRKIFEAEFAGTIGEDAERDLNGLVTQGVQSVAECMELCKTYKYFGMQWGSMCSCGNEVGQHGEAEAVVTAESCDTGGFINPTLAAQCAAVPLGDDWQVNKAACVGVASKYIGVAQKMTWAEADAYCKANYANLASIHSETGHENAKAACADVSGDVQCWIGFK